MADLLPSGYPFPRLLESLDHACLVGFALALKPGFGISSSVVVGRCRCLSFSAGYRPLLARGSWEVLEAQGRHGASGLLSSQLQDPRCC